MRGDKCQYLHDKVLPAQEIAALKEKRAGTPCRRHAQGICKYGDACQYLHSETVQKTAACTQADREGEGGRGRGERERERGEGEGRGERGEGEGRGASGSGVGASVPIARECAGMASAEEGPRLGCLSVPPRGCRRQGPATARRAA